MVYFAYGLTTICIIATILLAIVVLHYKDDNPAIETNRSRNIEFIFLGLLIAVDFMLISLIKTSFGA